MPLNHDQNTCRKLHVCDWRTLAIGWRFKDTLLCNDFVLVFMVTASLHILISVKIPATNGGAFSSVISKVHCFKLYYGSGLAHILYFIMHEVICTCFLNAPGIYNQYSGFNRSTARGTCDFGVGRVSGEDNTYCVWTHLSLREGHQSMWDWLRGLFGSRDLPYHHRCTNQQECLTLMVSILRSISLCITKFLRLLCTSRYCIMNKIGSMWSWWFQKRVNHPEENNGVI